MIYAIQNNKVNRGIYKANEDALTSSIFERFMYLPHLSTPKNPAAIDEIVQLRDKYKYIARS